MPSNATSASGTDASRKAARCGPEAAALALPAAVEPLSASDGEEDVHVEESPEQLDGTHSPRPNDRKPGIRLLDLASLSLEGSQGHSNEDRVLVASTERFHLFAVMDGHGGSWAGDFLVERLLAALEEVYDDGFEHARVTAAMEELDRVFCALAKRRMDLSGACLLAVLLFVDPATSTPQKLVLNIGDCRAVIRETPTLRSEAGNKKSKGFRPKSKKPKAQILALSSDHCAANSTEKLRAVRSGAVIQHGRIAGVLEPFRSIGDIDMKTAEMKNWVIPTPELRQSELLLGQSLLVLATDGVWGVMSNQRVMAVAQREMHTRGLQAAAAAEAIALEARDCGSTDDVSVVIISV